MSRPETDFIIQRFTVMVNNPGLSWLTIERFKEMREDGLTDEMIAHAHRLPVEDIGRIIEEVECGEVQYAEAIARGDFDY